MWWIGFLFASFLIATICPAAYSLSPPSQYHPQECDVLARFISSIRVRMDRGVCMFGSFTESNLTGNCCAWDSSRYSIGCDSATGHVTSFSLTCSAGNFSFGKDVFQLPFLQNVKFRNNDFELSSIPEEIGNLHHLISLEMSSSNFSGTIPISLSNPTNLDLRRNQLTGQFPSFLFNLPNLTNVNLEKNRLQGFLPDSNLAHPPLTHLNLDNNLLDGKIPFWLFTWTQLKELNLGHNRFTGSTGISRTMIQQMSLEILVLSDNQLSEELEWSMFKPMVNLSQLSLDFNRGLSLQNRDGFEFNFPKLKEVNLNHCNLTEFPNFLGVVDSLENLKVSSNIISGTIFRGERGWKNLSLFDASYNFITKVEQYPKRLFWLDMRNNLLEGSLPLSTGINFIFLQNNKLSGELPVWFCNYTTPYMILSFNSFHGTLPTCIGNFTELWVFRIQGNQLHGIIPDVFKKLTTLDVLDLGDNNFQGQLPRSLKRCPLSLLNVGNNNLTDSFPDWLESRSYMTRFILRSNNFHGEIGIP